MKTTNSNGLAPQFTEYYQLLAEYRACQKECRERIDRLRSAERKLQECAMPLGIGPVHVSSNEKALLRSHALADMPGLKHLSGRELEVFRLIGEGLATHEIAERLNLANSTIETYRERLKQKLNLSTGAALTRCAIIQAALSK
jgi:DNA-binding NarL/FixJ family response regulator